MLMRSPLARERRRPAGFILPCQPTLSDTVPSGPLWLHEIKHNGYRIMAGRKGTGCGYGRGTGETGAGSSRLADKYQ
jgi:hypothetical protein